MPLGGRIVIVGGGIAGLSLARVLNARNIPNIVLERNKCGNRIDYGLNLRRWACQPLCERLGWDYSSFRTALAGDFPVGERGRIGSPMIDAKSGDPVVLEPSSFNPTAPEDGYFRGRFQHLRALLSDGVDIRYGCCAHKIFPTTSGAIVECIGGQDNQALGSFEGTLVVGADAMNSTIRKQSLPQKPVLCMPAIVLQAQKYMSRAQFDLEVGPYMNGSSFLTGCVQAWRLCIYIESFEVDTVLLTCTYSRPCKSLSEYALLYPVTLRGASLPLDKVPELIAKELNELGPLAPPFGVTHGIEGAQDGLLRLLRMRARRDTIHEYDRGDRAATFVVPPVIIGRAAHSWPQFLEEGENHAIADAIHLGELIASCDEDQKLRSVAQNFHETAYHKRWLKAALSWEYNFCTFHGIRSPMNHTWRPLQPNGKLYIDAFDKLRGFRPEDGDEGLTRLQKAAMRENYAISTEKREKRVAALQRRNAGAVKRKSVPSNDCEKPKEVIKQDKKLSEEHIKKLVEEQVEKRVNEQIDRRLEEQINTRVEEQVKEVLNKLVTEMAEDQAQRKSKSKRRR